MTQGERVKELRKNLGLTLEKFGEKLGVTKTTISRIEKSERSLTEQMTKSICREFNVDYIWLTTGLGEMFVSTDETFLEKIDQIMAGENEFHRDLIKLAVNLDIKELEALESMMNKFLEIKGDKSD